MTRPARHSAILPPLLLQLRRCVFSTAHPIVVSTVSSSSTSTHPPVAATAAATAAVAQEGTRVVWASCGAHSSKRGRRRRRGWVHWVMTCTMGTEICRRCRIVDAFAYLSRCCCVFAEEEDELNMMISRGQGGWAEWGWMGMDNCTLEQNVVGYIPTWLHSDWLDWQARISSLATRHVCPQQYLPLHHPRFFTTGNVINTGWHRLGWTYQYHRHSWIASLLNPGVADHSVFTYSYTVYLLCILLYEYRMELIINWANNSA